MALNVLVVDDSAVMRTMVRRTLEMSGLELGEIHQAGNGREALAVLEEAWVDLVLADINMPVMNGEELVTEIRRSPVLSSIPIVVISTEGSETRIERLRQLGAVFIHKPFTPEAIAETVQGVLETCHE